MRAELARNVRETGSSLGWLLTGYAAPDADAAIAAFQRVQRSRASLRGRAGHRQRVLAQEGLRARDRGVRPRARHRDRRTDSLQRGPGAGPGRRRSWGDPLLAPSAARRSGSGARVPRARRGVPARSATRPAPAIWDPRSWPRRRARSWISMSTPRCVWCRLAGRPRPTPKWRPPSGSIHAAPPR